MNGRTLTAIRALVLCGLVNLWCSANHNAAAQSQPVWQTVAIPNLPSGSSLGHVWARNRNEAYVWANRITDARQAFLFRWDGVTWSQVLGLTNYTGGKIFGTGTSETFISADYYPSGIADPSYARIFRSTDNGINWTPQTLPTAVANGVLGFGTIGGTPNNVHVGTGAHIVRFDGTSWNTVFTSGIYGLTLVGPNEGYYVNCLNWGSWNGVSWANRGSASLGCDVYGGVWGLRGVGGNLSMYAVGQNNFNNGVRVWGFNEASQTWGPVFSDGTSGNGIGVWGSASNDVYVVGELISGPTHDGRVYHYNGASWQQVTDVGSIPRPGGVAGTAANDVWVSLGSAGTMLHYAPPPPSLAIAMYAGITITGQTNATYQIQYSTNLSSPTNWTALTNLTLPSSPYLFFDATSSGRPMSFYRALLLE